MYIHICIYAYVATMSLLIDQYIRSLETLSRIEWQGSPFLKNSRVFFNVYWEKDNDLQEHHKHDQRKWYPSKRKYFWDCWLTPGLLSHVVWLNHVLNERVDRMPWNWIDWWGHMLKKNYWVILLNERLDQLSKGAVWVIIKQTVGSFLKDWTGGALKCHNGRWFCCGAPKPR